MKTSLIAALMLAAPLSAQEPARVQMLVTPEEAARPEVSPREFRGLFPGPAITMVSPTEAAAARPLNSPFRLKFDFTPRNQAKVDLSSVKVVYLKSPNVDLTPRLLSSMSTGGIDVPRAALPPGRHSFYISVVDSSGNRGVAAYTLNVAR